MRFQPKMVAAGLAACVPLAAARGIELARREPAPEERCIDCSDPILANPGWANGVLYYGNYYDQEKSGNWKLGDTANGPGTLELRQDDSGTNYLYNFCPSTHTNWCLVYLAQIVTLQAGVQYEIEFDYQMSGVRVTNNWVQLYIEDLPDRSHQLTNQFFFSGTTSPANQWINFKSTAFQVSTSADYRFTLVWQNDPNNAVVMFKDIKQTATLCKDPDFVPVCPVSSSALPSSSVAPSSSSALPSSSAVPSSSAAPSSSVVASSSAVPSSSAAPSSSSALPSSSLMSSAVPSSSIMPSSSAALSSSIISSSAAPSSALPSSSAAPSSSKRGCRRGPRSSAVPSAASSAAPSITMMTVT